jgi:hypothetical protein
MKRILSGAVAVVLVVSSSGAGPSPEEVRAVRAAGYRMAREQPQPPFPVVPPPPGPAPVPWAAPSPFPWVIPGPDRGSAAFAPGPYDRCLITVDSSAIDSHFVVPAPDIDARMVVAPRVTGLPAGSWPYGPRRR